MPNKDQDLEAFVQISQDSVRIVLFDGFVVNLFKSDTGSLGITVDTPREEFVDIFVDENLKITVV